MPVSPYFKPDHGLTEIQLPHANHGCRKRFSCTPRQFCLVTEDILLKLLNLAECFMRGSSMDVRQLFNLIIRGLSDR